MSVAREKVDKTYLLQQLDERFRAPLMGFFLRRLGNRQDAEDYTQETFSRLIGSASIENIEQANAYIFKIAGNLLLDRARSAARRGVPHVNFDPDLREEIIAGFMSDVEPERVLIGRESVAEALACLEELGARTKNIFILLRLEGMKKKDVASLYGISLSTVDRAFALAVAHLAKRFGRYSP